MGELIGVLIPLPIAHRQVDFVWTLFSLTIKRYGVFSAGQVQDFDGALNRVPQFTIDMRGCIF